MRSRATTGFEAVDGEAAGGVGAAADAVDAIDAATTTAIAATAIQVMPWPRSAQPARAAITGSRLSSTPKTRGVSRRRAANSSEYGMSEDSRATAASGRSSAGCATRVPTDPTPNGTMTTAPTTMASASGPWPATVAPTFLPARM